MFIILEITIITLIIIAVISLINESKHPKKVKENNISSIPMKEKTVKFWMKFHRLGRFNYILTILLVCIIVGNISEQVVNVIYSHKFIFTFDEIVKTTICWVVFGLLFSNSSWKNNEISYENYIKQHNKI